MKIVKGYKEKEAAIALFLGYTYHGNRASKHALKWESPNGTYLDSPPPYTRCLNAMAKARESLVTYEQKMNYAWHLDNLVNPEGPTFHFGGDGKQYPGPNWSLADASAAHHADAFGKTHNLWK